MYDYKYKKKYNYKGLTKEDIVKISDIINSIGGISLVKIKSYRQCKHNKLVEEDKNEFSSFEKFITYLDKDINYLDELCISLKTEEDEYVDLEYDKYFNNWEITYKKPTKTIDSLLLNIRNIFKWNIIDLYKKYRWCFFGIIYVIQIFLSYFLKLNNKYVDIYSLFLLFIMITNWIIKLKPYKNNKYIKRNKDNIVFYILGVITPYIIELIIYLFNH